MKLPERILRAIAGRTTTEGQPSAALRSVEQPQRPSAPAGSETVVLTDSYARRGSGRALDLPESYEADDPRVLRNMFGIDPDDGEVFG